MLLPEAASGAAGLDSQEGPASAPRERSAVLDARRGARLRGLRPPFEPLLSPGFCATGSPSLGRVLPPTSRSVAGAARGLVPGRAPRSAVRKSPRANPLAFQADKAPQPRALSRGAPAAVISPDYAEPPDSPAGRPADPRSPPPASQWERKSAAPGSRLNRARSCGSPPPAPFTGS
ncbi:hypothetical protein ACRRTK_017437 [Alexandromys fortis]